MKAKFLYPILIVAVISLAYLNSLFNGFAWLDQSEILNGKLIISDFQAFIQMLFLDDNNYQGYHRPMYNLIHTFDWVVWGENAFGYHLSSLLIHLANSLLIYLIAVNFSQQKQLALFIALTFGVLPCHTATVSLIHSKADLLCCFFILLPILFYSHFECKNARPPSAQRVIILSGFLLVALLSKELAIMLPFFVITMAFLTRNHKMAIQRSYAIFPTIIGVLFLGYRLSVTDSIANPDSLSFIDRLLSFIPVYVNYITHTLSGFELTTNDAIRIWNKIPTGIYSLYLIAFVLLLSAQLYFSRKNLAVAAGFIWFNIFLIPVSQFIPILHFRADRFIYIPSIGFILAIALIFAQYYNKLKWKNKKNIVSLAIAILLLAASIRIWDRNKDFVSTKVMFEELIRTHPECREAQGFVGNEYLLEKDYEKALLHINKALQDQPDHYSFVDRKSNNGNLAVIYMQQNKVNQALTIFLKLKQQKNYDPEVLFNIGICQKKLRNYTDAKQNLEEYLVRKPGNPDALFGLGQVGIESGDNQLAQKYFTQYLEIKPNSEFRKPIEDFLKTIVN